MDVKTTTTKHKPLAGVRRKLVKAINATKESGVGISHTWGYIQKNKALSDPVSYSKLGEYQGQTCPMGAVILTYDDVDGIIGYARAAAKILKTEPANIEAFIMGYDETADRKHFKGTERRWYDLGVSMRRYAGMGKIPPSNVASFPSE